MLYTIELDLRRFADSEPKTEIVVLPLDPKLPSSPLLTVCV